MKGLSTILFGSLKPVVLCEHELPNPITHEEFFPISVFNKLIVNMTSCSEVEEEKDEEDGTLVNSSGEMDKILAALKAMPVYLN